MNYLDIAGRHAAAIAAFANSLPRFKAVLYPKLYGTTDRKAGRRVDAPN